MELTRSYKDPCKDTISGVRRMYVAKYNFLKKFEYTVEEQTLISMPSTFVYEFDLTANGNSYKENLNSDGSYTQNLDVILKAVDKPTNKLMDTLLTCEFRVVFELYNGLYKIFGFENGLSVNSIKAETGGAKNSFNGYTFNFEGLEKQESYYVDNLHNAGLIFYREGVFAFQDFEPFLFMDNDIYEIT